LIPGFQEITFLGKAGKSQHPGENKTQNEEDPGAGTLAQIERQKTLHTGILAERPEREKDKNERRIIRLFLTADCADSHRLFRKG
jgi:hypothetical protein